MNQSVPNRHLRKPDKARINLEKFWCKFVKSLHHPSPHPPKLYHLLPPQPQPKTTSPHRRHQPTPQPNSHLNQTNKFPLDLWNELTGRKVWGYIHNLRQTHGRPNTIEENTISWRLLIEAPWYHTKLNWSQFCLYWQMPPRGVIKPDHCEYCGNFIGKQHILPNNHTRWHKW